MAHNIFRWGVRLINKQGFHLTSALKRTSDVLAVCGGGGEAGRPTSGTGMEVLHDGAAYGRDYGHTYIIFMHPK